MEGAGGELAVVILAAGKGTRMKSRRSKVLHEVCGRPMLGYPLAVSEALTPARTLIVVGRDASDVQERFAGRAEFVLQAEQRGTGHAVLQTESKLREHPGEVLVLYADTPLLRSETLVRMRALKRASGAGLVMLSARVPLPGRVVRDARGHVERVVETTDATPAELAIEEGNTGVYLVDAPLLWEALDAGNDANAQGELYLTDLVSFAVRAGRGVEALCLDDPDESLGVNDRAELAEAERVMRQRIIARWLSEGVTFVDPESTYVDADATIGADTRIEPGCVIQGASRIGRDVHLKAGSYIEASRVDDGVEMGPYAHLRPGCHLMEGVRVGNFVEVKNSQLGPGVKADHLAYIGDADVGERASFGCGAIVVNYDWQTKARTRVGAGARIGCNVNLVAPVEVAARSAVAAGSTITEDVPEDALAVARARQTNVEGWTARREGRAPAASASASARRGESGTRAAAAAPAKARSDTSKKRSGASQPRSRAGKTAGGAAEPRSTTSQARAKKATGKARIAKKSAKKKSAARPMGSARKSSKSRRPAKR